MVARRSTRLLIGVLAAQATVGFAQYFSGLPVSLVELHVTGAAVLAAAATAVVLALHAGRSTSSRSAETPRSAESIIKRHKDAYVR